MENSFRMGFIIAIGAAELFPGAIASGYTVVVMQYAIVIERSADGYGAYVPDLPGVGVVGDTIDDVKQLIREAIDFHLDGMREDGQPIPEASTQIDYVDTTAA
jgi:predicted RNase H-like HicB family nuclease